MKGRVSSGCMFMNGEADVVTPRLRIFHILGLMIQRPSSGAPSGPNYLLFVDADRLADSLWDRSWVG